MGRGSEAAALRRGRFLLRGQSTGWQGTGNRLARLRADPDLSKGDEPLEEREDHTVKRRIVASAAIAASAFVMIPGTANAEFFLVSRPSRAGATVEYQLTP